MRILGGLHWRAYGLQGCLWSHLQGQRVVDGMSIQAWSYMTMTPRSVVTASRLSGWLKPMRSRIRKHGACHEQFQPDRGAYEWKMNEDCQRQTQQLQLTTKKHVINRKRFLPQPREPEDCDLLRLVLVLLDVVKARHNGATLKPTHCLKGLETRVFALRSCLGYRLLSKRELYQRKRRLWSVT